MKKCDIPKPKYDINNVLVFQTVATEQQLAVKAVGTVEQIGIVLKKDAAGNDANEVSYTFKEHDGLLVSETEVIKRVSV